MMLVWAVLAVPLSSPGGLDPVLSCPALFPSFVLFLFSFLPYFFPRPGLGAVGPRGPLLLGGLIARRLARWPPLLCDLLDDIVGERL